MAKNFLTYEQQLHILEYDKQLAIPNHEYAIKKLEELSYYSLIGGYKSLFKHAPSNRYIHGVTFDELVENNVNHKIKALADDMQNSDQGDWYGKGDIIMVNNYSIWNHDKYVDTYSPMQDGKHNADGAFTYTSATIGGELDPAEFKKYCSKASANTRYYVNSGDAYYTNASLARGGLYMNGKFYKIYNR